MLDFGMTIGGRQVSGQDTFAVLNPATGAVVGTVTNATTDDLDRAVSAAKLAYPSWAALPDADRQKAIGALAGALDARKEELAELLTQENGKPLAGLGSHFELAGAVAWTGYTASLEMPVKVLQDDDEGRVELHRKSLGVVGSITPWNWPLIIAIWHIMPALRAGQHRCDQAVTVHATLYNVGRSNHERNPARRCVEHYHIRRSGHQHRGRDGAASRHPQNCVHLLDRDR